MKKAISIVMAIMMILSIGISAFAANGDFRPSVESKGVPVIVPQEHNSELYDALVLGQSNEVIEGLKVVSEETPDGEIIVTAYSEIEEADPRVNVVYMEKSYKEVLDAQSLQELEATIPEGMVVRDFFDVTLVGTYATMFDEGKKLSIKFDISADANEKIMVLTRCSDESGWQFVESINVNEDGTVTVVFDELCPVIFLTDAEGVVESPATSDYNTAIILAMAVVFGFSSIAMFAISKKKSSIK